MDTVPASLTNSTVKRSLSNPPLISSVRVRYRGKSGNAKAIMGNADRPELGEELTNSFCRTDPEIAKRFARTTFLSDNRADLGVLDARVLVMQCREDVIAPVSVGEFVQRSIPGSEFVLLDATGHCPNLSAPEETIAAIRAFV